MSGRRIQRREEPIKEGQEIKAGPARVPPEILHGVYANGIRSFGTSNEVVIDFSLVVPTEHRTNEAGELLAPRVDHQVVARVILPIAVFQDWFGKLEKQRRDHAAASQDGSHTGRADSAGGDDSDT